MNDLKFAFRQLLKKPGFTAVVVSTLALGIGATTTVFSIIDPLLLQPVPGPHAARLVEVLEVNFPQNEQYPISPPVLHQLRQATNLLDSVASYVRFQGQLEGDIPERVVGSQVSANLFGLLGASPLIGRPFSTEDEREGAPPVFLISHGFWQRRFGGDPSVIGRTVIMNNDAATIIGVMPPSFQFPNRGWLCEFWMPENIRSHERHDSHARDLRNLNVIARLASSVSLQQAQAGVDLITRVNADLFQETSAGWGLQLQPARAVFSDTKLRSTLWTLFGSVTFVLLICCANVANLQLVRGEMRRREMVVRLALGSSRGRLIRLALVESLLLAILGCALGLLFSIWGNEIFASFGDVSLPQLRDIQLNSRVAGFAVALSVVCSVGFGLVCAFRWADISLDCALKASALGTKGNGRSFRWQRAFIIIEIALAMSLAMGALLMIRSLANVAFTDAGFDTRQLGRFGVYFEDRKATVDSSRVRLDELVSRIRRLPGVTSVGVHFHEGEQRVAADGNTSLRATFVRAGVEENDLTRTLGISLLGGRLLTRNDAGEGFRNAVISESLAKALWPGKNPMDQLFRSRDSNELSMSNAVFRVVGVVADLWRDPVEGTLREQPKPVFYLAAARNDSSHHAWVYLRSSVKVHSLERLVG